MLTERQRMILNAIVDDYIRSAEPVGSRSISKHGGIGFSPATIRNEMADLEELGFLEQPHTSAGRIPSTQGYRYYVDHLVKVSQLGEEELARVRSHFAMRMNQMEQIIQHAAMILSNITNYTSIVLGPEMFSNSLKVFQLVPLNDRAAVAIVVTNTGHVENRTISIPPDFDVTELEKVVGILNAKLAGVPLHRLQAKLYSEVGEELGRHVEHYESIMDSLAKALETDQEHRVFLSGASNMLTQPEFKDVDKVKMILDWLDETPTLMKAFASASAGIQVRIGTENDDDAIRSCSLITASYSVDGKSLGTIGLLGPTRMDYGKVISLLDVLSKDIALGLARWYK
ncbi:HrcA family transcriptional regulator [Paenibacillus darwinianus]|uniref:Heat-inducible transcription repressor HrcA n=1 Tax=Paenibacillus darwinianus TaxID=1380763 RepID=A0A9W5S0Q4_9BACL|nr:heat-inducible transcriptional repressor HrcA [Paenibacillus darwinianus]EXX87963.1 HrcA family transcriptional regulator [Paenibacillus darwinianus]EXX88049.1 HrcA family transcriptional regulator [Paenibacillus darwinianus]EXX89191.1 HrcA family transcriptional regulator [Paenibacillus darwinianus]